MVNKNSIKILDKKCEYGINPVGIDKKNPRFSWNIKAEKERGAGAGCLSDSGV